MRKTDETRIGKIRVISEKLEALDAMELIPIMGKAITGAASRLEGVSLEGVGTLAQMELDQLAPALHELFSQMESSDMRRLVGKILQGTIVVDTEQGEKWELTTEANINAAFAGRLPVMFSVLGWVLKFNFADFFGADLMAKVNAASRKDPPTAEEKA